MKLISHLLLFIFSSYQINDMIYIIYIILSIINAAISFFNFIQYEYNVQKIFSKDFYY